jgi:hypothetical protein
MKGWGDCANCGALCWGAGGGEGGEAEAALKASCGAAAPRARLRCVMCRVHLSRRVRKKMAARVCGCACCPPQEHFVCTDCRCPFPDMVFFEKDGHPYCQADYARRFCEKFVRAYLPRARVYVCACVASAPPASWWGLGVAR